MKRQEIKLKQSSEGTELLLAAMAFNSNLPIIHELDKDKLDEKEKSYRLIRLPILGERYSETIEKLVNQYPIYNEMFMFIGLISEDSSIDSATIHTNVVRYLAEKGIEYNQANGNRDWLVKFPDEIIQSLIKRNYFHYLEDSCNFVNHFYSENFLNQLRKLGDEKSKQYQKRYINC